MGSDRSVSLPHHVAACLTATVLMLLLLAHLAIGNKAIELAVSPRLAVQGPVTLSLRVRVHAEPQDRWITVQMDDGDFRRESTWAPDPNRTLYTFNWRDVPGGDYEVVAAIGDAEHVRATDRQSVQIGVP